MAGRTITPNMQVGASVASPESGTGPVNNGQRAPLSSSVNRNATYSFAGQSGPVSLALPQGVNNDYTFVMTVHDYKRDSWRSVAQTQVTGAIALPFPLQMVDEMGVKYEQPNLGLAGAAGQQLGSLDYSSMGSLGSSINSKFQQFNGSDAIANAKGAGVRLGENLLKDGGNAIFGAGNGTNAVNGFKAAQGLATNDFMTVMLTGPEYKMRDFIWKIVPESAQEAQILQKIGIMLKEKSAFSLGANLGSAYFEYPSVFRPVFKSSKGTEAWTFSMKPSVLVRASFNYTPTGGFVPRNDGSPFGVEIRMQFLELELWLRGDYAKAAGVNV
jgi:hypothetical protein